MARKRIIDLTLGLGSEAIDYPGDPPYRRELVLSLAAGASCELSRLSLSAHSGTHLDAPSHFIAGGKSLDRYPAREFILPAQVVAIKDPEAVKVSELGRVKVRKGEALLFKTRNSISGLAASGKYSRRYVYLAAEAAHWCATKKLGLVGIDYVTIDRAGDESHPAHHALLSAGVLVLEAVNLRGVAPGRYTLICLPLKIKDAEASPVRAVLVK